MSAASPSGFTRTSTERPRNAPIRPWKMRQEMRFALLPWRMLSE